MARKDVVVCDMYRGIYTSLTQPRAGSFTPASPTCDRLATSQCPVCHRDVCPDHLAFKLQVVLANVSPPENPQHQPPKPLLKCATESLAFSICIECHLLFTGVKENGGRAPFGTGETAIPWPKIDTVTHMQALLDALCIELGAARATIALTD